MFVLECGRNLNLENVHVIDNTGNLFRDCSMIALLIITRRDYGSDSKYSDPIGLSNSYQIIRSTI